MYIRILWSEDWNSGKQVWFNPLRGANLPMMKKLHILYNDSLHDGLVAPQQHSGGSRMTGRICHEAAVSTWEHWTPLVDAVECGREYTVLLFVLSAAVRQNASVGWITFFTYVWNTGKKEMVPVLNTDCQILPIVWKFEANKQAVKNPVWYLVPDTMLGKVNKQHAHILTEFHIA